MIGGATTIWPARSTVLLISLIILMSGSTAIAGPRPYTSRGLVSNRGTANGKRRNPPSSTTVRVSYSM